MTPSAIARAERNRAAGCCRQCSRPAVVIVRGGVEVTLSRCAECRDKASAYAAGRRSGRKIICSTCGAAGHNSRRHSEEDPNGQA